MILEELCQFPRCIEPKRKDFRLEWQLRYAEALAREEDVAGVNGGYKTPGKLQAAQQPLFAILILGLPAKSAMCLL